MIVSWMLYATALAGALMASASLAERALRGRSRPARAAWAIAIALSVLLPVAAWARAGSSPAAATELGSPEVVDAPAFAGASGPMAPAWRAVVSALEAVDPYARRGWGAASALLFAAFAVSALRLGVRVRRWRPCMLEGQSVRVSHDVGPAVVGWIRPQVVVPSWVLDLPAAERVLILRHEREHVRARDPWLVLGGFAAVWACPWNPFLWGQLARLRAAAELDCDRRVVRGRPWSERRRYGLLLVAVGARVGTGAHRPALAAFAERTSSLERRIRTMFVSTRRPSAFTVGATLAGAALLLAGACLAPGPDRESPTEPSVESAPAATSQAAPDVPSQPVFTPFTVGPEIVNRVEAQESLAREYPPLLRDAGIGGTTTVWFYIDEQGVVQDTRLQTSSGQAALDDAALAVASVLRFTPALNRDQRVPVWVTFPIVFSPR